MSYKNYEWRTGRSQIFHHFYHLVFVTKYRRGVFTKEMLDRVAVIFKETCEQMDCIFHEFNGEDDHVHILISIPPKHSVTNVVSKLKGKSSYFMRKEFWEHVRKKLWGKHFWSPSYCSVTCGGAPLEVIKKYIENQKRPSSERGVAQSMRERKVRLQTD